MKVFQKVQEIIEGTRLHGHALKNLQNKVTLPNAKREIEQMLKGKR